MQDWFFDMIIGFLRSPRWKSPVMSFIDEYCTVFDDEDENKLEFTKIHNVSCASIVNRIIVLMYAILPL